MKPFKCDNVQYFKIKNNDLQFTITDRFCVNTRRYGLNSLSYFAPKVWDMILLQIKNINSLQKFKTEIRKWAPENCSCYLCRPYVQNLGFVELA